MGTLHLHYSYAYTLQAPSILRDGIQQRFCQQCGRFHTLDQFDGTRRSCRAMLQRHNARRNKRNADGLPLPPADGTRSVAAAQAAAAAAGGSAVTSPASAAATASAVTAAAAAAAATSLMQALSNIDSTAVARGSVMAGAHSTSAVDAGVTLLGVLGLTDAAGSVTAAGSDLQSLITNLSQQQGQNATT
jgi:hypothetical protein